MHLYNYLIRLERILQARQDVTVEELRVVVTTLGAIFQASIRFSDESTLHVIEELERTGGQQAMRIQYAFHYQDANGKLVFRYDNAPHHPHLATFPAHKHLGDTVVEAQVPDLADVLREIDSRRHPEAEDHDSPSARR